MLEPNFSTEDVFEPLFMATNDEEDNEDEIYMPISHFVKTLSFGKYEHPDSLASLVVIQSVCRGYLLRLKDPSDAITTPLDESPFTSLLDFSNQQEVKHLLNPSDHSENSDIPLEKRINFSPRPIIENSDSEEEEINNLLYETDVIYENPLHEMEIVTENQLYEPDEEIYENPLFETSKSIWDEEEEEFILFVESLKSKLVIKDHHIGMHVKKQTFTGKNLIDVLTNRRFTRADAVYIAQSLMDRFVFKPAKIHQRSFVDDDATLYRFVEDYSNKSVLNAPPIDFDVRFAPKLREDRVVRKIENLWKVVCNEYVKISSKSHVKIGYTLLATSKEWLELVRVLYRLHKFDPLVLDENTRKAFFINIYNIMVIHALTLCGRPNSVIARTLFFKTKYYVIGNYKVSLDDIEHIVLRGNHSIPQSLFVQCFGVKNAAEISVELDPRIHFALHRATVSSPVLQFYDPMTLNEELDLAAKIYLQSQIKMDSNVIHVPKLFYLFGEDFGSIKKQLDFIAMHLNDTQKTQFQQIRKIPQFILQYQPYNWKLNQKEKTEEVQDLRVEFREVVGLLEYRNFFKKFAVREVAEESILCYEQLEKYSLLAKESEKLALAKSIFETYLIPGSPREINIYQKPVQYVRECIKTQTLKKDIFEEVNQCLMDCMIDIYARFQSSPEYQEMILLQMENRMKEAVAGPEGDLIGASTMTMNIGIHSKDISTIQKRVSPYYTNVFEKYDRWKDSVVIESGFEEVVPDVRRNSHEKRKTIAHVQNHDAIDWSDRFSEKMIQKLK